MLSDTGAPMDLSGVKLSKLAKKSGNAKLKKESEVARGAEGDYFSYSRSAIPVVN